MANIAPILGALSNTFMEKRFVGDVNTLIPEHGHVSFYMAWSGSTNLPTNISAGYLIAFRWTHSYFAKQIIITDNAIYHRNKTGEDTWSEWYQL